MIPKKLLQWLPACLAASIWIGSGSLLSAPVGPSVRVWEAKIVIPTYLAGAPEPNPMFFFGRQSQGAQGPVYPYPMYDTLTGKKVDNTYTAVYLENEYLRIGVLPEIGGRIFEGVDKTDNYNFIYRQHVIKPALIGLIGAWISGGLEWNIPHHHRASTFIPVQYKTEENPDGSKTIWVGELEVRQRMRWAVGYTLRPGKSYLEAAVRIVNRTPEVNTMLCFANLAVHADNDYQVIFPPSTQYGVFHAKREFTAWPISTTRYAGADFTKGVDISWYKNHQSANSVFAWNYRDDFFAGYDHGKEAGTMSVADHNIVPGKKFWTWGNGPSGRTWDKTLTDDDGPYIELMVGAYSDNQPDYTWLQPYETRSFTMNWYPFRDIGGVKKANLDAAVNLEVSGGSAKVGFYTTSAHTAAQVRLQAGGKTLLQETVAINPAKPYVKKIALPAGIDEHDLVASISDQGKELVSYRPIRLTPEPMPKAVTPPAPPQEVKTTEELYLTGLRAQQFHDPIVDPLAYWEEALRRDSGDTRVNTALGITAFRQARYADAGKYLRTALDRLTDRYTTPKDAEATYYLGATLKAEGKFDDAYTNFYKATWSQAWKAASYYSLAELAASRGNMAAALDFVNRSIDSNALNTRAQNLKAAVLRHLGRPKEAIEALSAAHRADPLDVRSMAENWLASKSPEAARTLASTMNLHPATAQETAAEYLNAGLWQDGADVLLQITAAAPDKSKIHPMAYYYLGYFADKLGQPAKAAEYDKLAMSMPPDYVFPFQNEAIDVLRAAMKANPRDARAPYYLGNVLYDWQPEEATKMWEASAEIDPSFAIVHRNLATAYLHQKPEGDVNRAIAELEKAVAADRKYPLHFAELDELYEETGAPLQKRVDLVNRNAAVVAQRDDAQNRAIALKIATGAYDEAIQMMTDRPFAVAEGANLNVAEHWTDAHILRARKEVEARRYQDAVADLQAATAIPANLPLGAAGFGSAARTAEAAYWMGVAYEGLGDRSKALGWFHSAEVPAQPAAGRRGGQGMGGISTGAQPYFQALALQKLGQPEKAKLLFAALVESGKSALQQATSTGGGRGGRAQSPRARTANAHYLIGLGYLGLNDSAQAKAELSQAVEISPDLVGARIALASIK
jgi:tetratricopeptide (TPR) repeat protein